MISDFAKMDHPAILHFGFRAILKYISTSSTTTTTTTTYEYPTPGDTKVIGTILSIAQQLDTTGTILHLSNDQEGASNNAEQKEKGREIVISFIFGLCGDWRYLHPFEPHLVALWDKKS
jgi:hypothetical protein